MNQQNQSIIIMSRVPKPGATKTRLTPPLSPEQACHVHQYILHHVSEIVREIHGSHYLFYTGGQTKEFRDLVDPGAFTFQEQQGNTLGERMSHAFDYVLSTKGHHHKVLMIGSDIPLLTKEHFQETFAALETSDVVLGPNDDGGYYLLGLTCSHPELFALSQWGTDSVFNATIAIAERDSLKVHLLTDEIDIDTIEDIDTLIRSDFLINKSTTDKKYRDMLDFFQAYL